MNRMLKAFCLILLFSVFSVLALAQESGYGLEENIHYYSDAATQSDAYITQRCVLDIYYPNNEENFATVVWFHGCGLRAGNKSITDRLKDNDLAIVAVNYRLSPKVKAPK